MIQPYTQEWSTYVAKGKAERYGLCFTWDIANVGNYEDYVAMPALAGPDGKINVTLQNGSEISGFYRGRAVLTSKCRNTALAAAWIYQIYEPIQSAQNNWGTYGEDDEFDIFELVKKDDGTEMLKHADLGTSSPVEVREAESVDRPLAILNTYYDKYVICPDDAQWRLNIIKDTYVKNMNSKYVFMSQEDDTYAISQY